jgi:hypothetical protein
MLYPSITLDPLIANLHNNVVPSGTLVVLPIDMTSVQMTQIKMLQISFTQDFSLRAWLSVYPGGTPLPPGYFPLLRTSGVPFVVYCAGQTPSPPDLASLVEPGRYMLNVLNLTNVENEFSFNKMDLV